MIGPAWPGTMRGIACGFSLTCEEFDHERATARTGKDWPVMVVVFPFTVEGQPIRRHGSWLSPHVRRVRFRDLTLDWRREHLLSRE